MSRPKYEPPPSLQDRKEMTPKTKEKGTKAGAQKKKRNAGAGESDWVEVGASQPLLVLAQRPPERIHPSA